jgi:hypothetical protein
VSRIEQGGGVFFALEVGSSSRPESGTFPFLFMKSSPENQKSDSDPQVQVIDPKRLRFFAVAGFLCLAGLLACLLYTSPSPRDV